MPEPTKAIEIGEVVIARSPLTAASYQKCLTLLQRGQVKRVLQRGPLVGYYLACPSCNGAFSYLHEKHGFVETDPLDGAAWPRQLVGVERPLCCYHCRSILTIERGAEGYELVARRAPL
jgi:uncharacterized protein YbaR (Trm112 family)